MSERLGLPNLPVVVEGLIGSGKTTCLQLLNQKYGVPVVLEPVEEWEPYLRLFYDDPPRWAFTLQIKIIQTMREQKLPKTPFVRERSIDATRHVFVDNLTASGFLNEEELDLIERFLPPSSYQQFRHVVYIDTPPEVCVRRIEERARASEKGVLLPYLSQLQNLYKRTFREGPSVTYVDGTQDVDAVTADIYRVIRRLGYPKGSKP